MAILYMERSSVESLTEADIKRLIEENGDVARYQHLADYYLGKHDILNAVKRDSTAPNNRIVGNMAKYITDTAVGYFLGKPVVYSSQDVPYHRKLQDIFDYNDEQDHNTELAKTGSICGSAIEMLYLDESGQIRLAVVDPRNCILLYDAGSEELLAALRVIHSADKNHNVITKVEFWDQRQCWYFRSVNGAALDLLDIKDHFWQDVPFVEFVNNKERTGDFEGVISIIDAYNRAQSNTANFFQYNDEAILKIMKLGDVTSQDVREMKEKGTVILEDGGDIGWLIKEVNDTALENYKKRLREDMHLFSSVPNLTDENFGGNLSGVAVSYKLWSMEQGCAIKERKFKRGLQRRIELITTMLNIKGGTHDFRDIEIQFRRNKPQNLLEIAQIMSTLTSQVSHETLLKMLPTIDDVQAELAKIAEEQKQAVTSFGSFDALTKALATAQQEPPVGAES